MHQKNSGSGGSALTEILSQASEVRFIFPVPAALSSLDEAFDNILLHSHSHHSMDGWCVQLFWKFVVFSK